MVTIKSRNPFTASPRVASDAKKVGKPSPKQGPSDDAMKKKEAAMARKNKAPASMLAQERTENPMMAFARGGRVDGIAQRGKTSGRVVKMKSGGRCK